MPTSFFPVKKAVALWPLGSAQRSLGESDVDVWLAPLDVSSSALLRLEQTLSADERERAARFHRPDDRRRYIAARGFLRRTLAGYLKAPPESLGFSYNAFGKPALAASGLAFNVSHSHGLALYAVTRERRIGVDVERIRPDFATLQIAERFFAPGEVARLRAVSPALQAQAFFDCWTRKEAFIKARGEGLSLPLDQFEVTLGPGVKPAITRADDDPQASQHWTLRELHPAANYAGAVAVEGQNLQFRLWRCPD
jgi:4'-phosphopantetheinyl transferase